MTNKSDLSDATERLGLSFLVQKLECAEGCPELQIYKRALRWMIVKSQSTISSTDAEFVIDDINSLI